MSFQLPRRPANRAALALLTSGVLLAISTSAAQAACSSQSHSAERERLMHSLANHRLFALELTADQVSPQHQPARGYPPCSGPGCSNRSFPSEAPVSRGVELEQDWCLVLPGLQLSKRLPARGSQHLLPARAVRVPDSIDRPPRSR